MKVTTNKSQFRALNDRRGLPPRAHRLVMCSRSTSTGGVLEGTEEDFAELVEFISEELAEGMLSATAARALVSLAVKLDPDCADWLGM